jgi:hypothetical protein
MAGTRITQLTPLALPGRRLGSFADKPAAGAVPTWPAGLPGPQAADFQEQASLVIVRSEIPVGVAEHRRRTRAGARPMHMTWRLTGAQLVTFETWYDEALGNGARAWSGTHPRTGVTSLWRLTGPYAIRALRGDVYDVSAEVESYWPTS